MNNDLLNKITAWESRAVWTEGGDGMFTVPVDGFYDLAGRLRADGPPTASVRCCPRCATCGRPPS